MFKIKFRFVYRWSASSLKMDTSTRQLLLLLLFLLLPVQICSISSKSCVMSGAFSKMCFCSRILRRTLSFQPFTGTKTNPFGVIKRPEKGKTTTTGKKRRKYNKTSLYREKLWYWLISNKVTGICQFSVERRNEMVVLCSERCLSLSKIVLTLPCLLL